MRQFTFWHTVSFKVKKKNKDDMLSEKKQTLFDESSHCMVSSLPLSQLLAGCMFLRS